MGHSCANPLSTSLVNTAVKRLGFQNLVELTAQYQPADD